MTKLGSVLLVVVPALVMACGEGNSDALVFPANLTDESLLRAPTCDAETRCADGLECIVVDLVEESLAICTDRSEVCPALDCGSGECVILESYPARVACGSGASEPDDGGDGVVSN